MKVYTIYLILVSIFFTKPIYADPVSTAKMVGVLMSQLKELKEVLEVSSRSLDELEKYNRKIQDNRLRVLRIRNIVETSKDLSAGTYKGIEGTTKLIRRSKNIAKDSKSLGDELVDDLSKEEIEKISEQLSELDNEFKSISDHIKVLQTERAMLLTKTGSTLKQADVEVGGRATVVSDILETQALDMPISPNTAQTLTAKNTAVANKINIQNAKINAQSLTVQQGILDHLKKEEISQLKERERIERLWGVKNAK